MAAGTVQRGAAFKAARTNRSRGRKGLSTQQQTHKAVLSFSSRLRWADGDTCKPESPAVSHQAGGGCEHAPAGAMKTAPWR